MCPNNVNDDINKLYEKVAKLNPDSPLSDHSYIESIEEATETSPNESAILRATRITPTQSPAAKVVTPPAPARPPPTPPPNLFYRMFSFYGEMRRGEFFWNAIRLAIISIVVIALIEEREIDNEWIIPTFILVAWSQLATIFKRWRNIGRSMWWLVTLLIPYVCFIMLLFLFFMPSKRGP